MSILHGYKVLDFGRYIAGPYCATLLADFGADVIRIEKLAGSEDRFIMPISENGDGALYHQINRNKRNMTLNPMKPKGREILEKLVETADIVVANLPGPGLTAMGLDYENLSRINPRIILTTVSMYGNSGPYADRVGFDGLGQAMAGSPHLSGPSDEPMRDILSVVDFGTAILSAFGTVAALLHREHTGKGQHVEGSLLHTAMTYSSSYLIEQAMLGLNRTATGNRSQTGGPADILKTKDGWIMVQVVGRPIFERWAKLVNRPDLLDDERFQSDLDRGNNGEVLSTIAKDHALKFTTEEILEAYAQASVPAGPVYDLQQTLDDPQVRQGGYIQNVRLTDQVEIPLVTAPIKASDVDPAIQMAALPLGHDTDRILETIGYSFEDIRQFRADRVV